VRPTALEITRQVRTGEVTARALAEAALADIEARGPGLGAFTCVTVERALADAARVDAAVAAGRDPGPLAGVPYAVKDLFDIAGISTKAGSKIHAARPPASRDAAAIRRLGEAGAVLLGALNMEEYAYGFYTDNSHHGRTRNPHDPERTAGGSSGGSGAAVAAGLVSFALGSDTNGSIRVPASFCGIFGLKPTYGRVSRSGSMLFVSSLDHIGPLARNVADLAAVYDVLQGPDPDDPVSSTRPPDPVSERLRTGTEGLRIAVAGGYFARILTQESRAAVASAAEHLGAVDEVEIAQAEVARAAAYVITSVEAARERHAELRERIDDFDPNTRSRFLAGALLPADWYVKAQQFRRWYAERLAELFRTWDVVLAPAVPMPAPRFSDETVTIDGREQAVRPLIGRFVQALAPAGLPIAVVPMSRGADLPIGVQLIGAAFREEDVLRAAGVLERGSANSERSER